MAVALVVVAELVTLVLVIIVVIILVFRINDWRGLIAVLPQVQT